MEENAFIYKYIYKYILFDEKKKKRNVNVVIILKHVKKEKTKIMKYTEENMNWWLV